MLLILKPDFRVPAHALRALIEISLICEAGVRPVSLKILTLLFELRATCSKLINNTIIGDSLTLTSNVLNLLLSLFSAGPTHNSEPRTPAILSFGSCFTNEIYDLPACYCRGANSLYLPPC